MKNYINAMFCYILTVDIAGCFGCVNKVIAGLTCFNRKATMRRCKQLTKAEPEWSWRYEMIYIQVPTK